MTKQKVKIAILDDSDAIRAMYKDFLESQGTDQFQYECTTVDDPLKLYIKLKRERFDLLLLDLDLKSRISGVDVLKQVKAAYPNMGVIIITSNDSIETAEMCLGYSADDYFVKCSNLKKLLIAIHCHLKIKFYKDKSESFEKELCPQFVGESEVVKKMRDNIHRVAPEDVDVLIQGESGTGKSIVAKMLHYLHPRRSKKKFIKVDCGQFQDKLMRAELFGHKRGSFTDAITDQVGKAVLADGGTIFFDEIHNLSLENQAMLLRFLDERVVSPLGDKEDTIVNVRIICATNENLEKLIEEKKFKEDLYFRIDAVNIILPSLEERREDIPTLIKHFIEVEDAAHRLYLSSDIISYLKNEISWKGNARQLHMAIKKILANKQSMSPSLDEVKEILVNSPKVSARIKVQEAIGMEKWLQSKEAESYEQLLKSGCSISDIARKFQMARSTLYDRLRRYGLLNLANETH